MNLDHALSQPENTRSALWPDGQYAALIRGGLGATAAYAEVVTELSDEKHRKVIADLDSYSDGRAALARVTQAWAEQGWPPPWQPGIAP